MGNYDRAAATLDAYGQATFPPIPDVVQTPRSGIALTHRVGLQFDANATSVATDNPRVKAEPAMNRWVGAILPPAGARRLQGALSRCGGRRAVHVRDAAAARPAAARPRVRAGSRQPAVRAPARRAARQRCRLELALRARRPGPRFRAAPAGARACGPTCCARSRTSRATPATSRSSTSRPLVRSLRALLLHSRPLRATDIALPTEAKADADNRRLARSRARRLPARRARERTRHAAHAPAGRARRRLARRRSGRRHRHRRTSTTGSTASSPPAACSPGTGCRRPGSAHCSRARASLIRRMLGKANVVVQRWQRLRDQFDR